ncbi:MAG TPA: hypothetical protein VHH54_05460 [Actinomycetota bacterium]|jgi:uncharacterized BrkB/YihY/UPF0761 family membrane protein|nr:hypothetical protein [Actinomycetota bacterium]
MVRRYGRGRWNRTNLLVLLAFAFFTLAAIFAGIPELKRDWPWLIPGGLAAWALASLRF